MAEIKSLYIHIPFCISKCKYCDFYSIPCNPQEFLDKYVDSLCNEIKYRISKYKIKNLETIYIGGGTPSLLSSKQLYKILDTAKQASSNNQIAEITIELNPDDISPELLTSLEKNGVTRISVGLQSMSDEVLTFAGRRAHRKENVDALECIKKNWKGKTSVDLISALPFETNESLENGIKEIVQYNPQHISFYSLTIEDETPFGKMYNDNKLDYDWDFADEMWLKGRNLLKKYGYIQYEVSNFCKAGNECKHNLAYWNHKNYLGCGAGACGTVYPLRWTNKKEISDYINFWQNDSFENIPQEEEVIDKEVEKFEFFMMGLRKLNGITDIEYKNTFGEDIPQNVKALFAEWRESGRAEITEFCGYTRYSLNETGILFLNSFLQKI